MASRSLLNTLILVLAGAGQGAAGSGLPAGTIVLKGHTETVYAVAFSPDGKQVATGSFDLSVRLWDTAGKQIRSFRGPSGHQRQVLTVAFSTDGRRLASGGEDNVVKIWDLASAPSRNKKPVPPAPLRSLGHPNIVDAVRFDPSGRFLATACHDGMVRIWDVARGQLVNEIKGHTDPQPSPVYCLDWSKSGDKLLTGSFDQTLKLWDARTGSRLRDFKAYNEKAFPKGHLEGVLCASLSPDGKRLASGSSDRTIRIWDIADGSVIGELANTKVKRPTGPAPRQAHRGWVNGLAYTPDGKILVSGGDAPGNQGELALWDVLRLRLINDTRLPIGAIYALALSPDGQRVALACGPADRNLSGGNAYIVTLAELGR